MSPPAVAANGAPLAEVWERFLAYLLDTLILSIINLIPLGIMVLVIWNRVHDALNRITVDNQRRIDSGRVADPYPSMLHLLQIELIGLAIFLPVALIISYLYMVTFMHRDGQTIGKRILKIRVVRAIDGGAITERMARLRWLGTQPAAIIAPYYQYADSLWLLWDKPYRQCLHDKLAETVVVKIKP